MAIAVDIGAILFRDILKITQYPGSPFSGNIINDVILYFFIPMVFVIFFIYMLLGRIVAGVVWLRMLMGLAIFLFMIVNGWFAIFALMSGPYFVFLIVVLGALYFIPSHFRMGGVGGRAAIMPALAKEADTTIHVRLREIDADIKRFESILEKARAAQSREEAGYYAKEIDRLRQERGELLKHREPWRKVV